MSCFPSDWPAAGPIDASQQDLPHRSADTEWWYINSHFTAADGRELSLFAAFFRIRSGIDEDTGAPQHAHSVTWALTDLTRGTYFPESRVDRKAPQMGLERIAKGRGAKDPRLNRAITEILERGEVPVPDRMFEGPVYVDSRKLALDYAGATLNRQDDGSYRLRLHNDREHVGCDLVLRPQKDPVRHGDNGVVRGTAGEHMFYYFMPRCELTGTITLEGRAQPLTAGQAWYDHEFGGYTGTHTNPGAPQPDEAAQADFDALPNMAWNWAAVQLSNGVEISAYEIVDCSEHKDDGDNDDGSSDAQPNRTLVGKWLVLIDANGTRRTAPDFSLEPGTTWRSTRTFHEYPVSWRLRAPSIGLDLTIDAALPDQEFITVISKPAFWEGRCDAAGTLGGDEVSGLAFIERSGFEDVSDLDTFFREVGKEVRKSVEEVISLDPSYEQMRDLVASEDYEHYMDGVDVPSMAKTLLAPIREITDRGGKSWRSYAALACCDVVGGDSRRFVKWLAMPELMHVGSLIVDDVQDRSEIRRGGKTCHLIYGEPAAINSGTAAYFITQHLLISDNLSSEAKLRIYDLYFLAMRAGHAGQAIDLGGMKPLMPGAVERGVSCDLEQRILACHRLKTAVPAASLARMGAVAGGGTDEQIDAVGRFFEALGLAFQIIDDVLNLRGFTGDLKARGEDIANGTVTLPVAKAMSRLEHQDRAWLWSTLQSRPDDPQVVARAVELLESCGAIEDCATQAAQLVEQGWQRAEAKLDPSIAKVMLRAFGWYVLQRHY